MNRTASYYGKSKLYNVNLKSIDIGADGEGLYHSLYLTSIYNTDTNENDYRIYTTDFKDVYEYDYNFNKLATLSEKINIKDFKVLGVLDGYAFIADNNYIYAIHLIDYKITKSNGMISYVKNDNTDPLYISHGFTLYNDTTLTGGSDFKFYTKNGKIGFNNNEYQMHSFKLTDGYIKTSGHIFCGLECDTTDKNLVIKYIDNTLIVIPE